MYLNELDKYLADENDEEDFYRSILEVLTQVNTAGFSRNVLTSLGQGVATDFITIYTAELNRHIMVDLHPSIHPWENDLAEATFVSIFSAKTGKLMSEGKLVDSPLKGFWALSSSGSGRSGIGINRRDRRKLQVLISAFERQEHPALVSAVEKVIGKRADGDVFRGLMEFLNNSKTQNAVRTNANVLTKSFVQLLLQVQNDSNKIVEFVKKN